MEDGQKITEWFHQYSNDVYNYLIYHTGRVDVEDMVQDVFIKALRHVHSFKEQASPKTWLISIARHVAIDEMRKRKREVDKQQKLIHYYEKNVDRSPEELYKLNETNKEIYRAILMLKQTYRDVLILRGIKEFSIKETADILRWSENKVRVTYHRAIKALEKKIGGLLNE